MPIIPKKLSLEAVPAARVAALDWLLNRVVPVPDEWLKPQSDVSQFVTRRLSSIPPEQVSWIWDNRIVDGKLNLIQGDPGQGKTWLVLDIASHLTTGTPFWDGATCEAGEVLFITAEDGIGDTIRPRLDILGADVEKIHFLDTVRDGKRDVTLDLDKHIQLCDAWLAKNSKVKAVVIDPISAFMGKVDTHRNSEVRAVLGKLSKLAERRKVAILAINHLAKSLAKAVHRSLGSIAFAAAARSVWQVSQDRDDPDRRLFLPVKMNLAKSKGLAYRITDSGLEWEEGDIDISADDAEADTGETPRGEAKAWLRDLLKNGPIAAKDVERVAKQDGICMRTIKYAKKELGIVSERRHGSWSWRLPNAKP